MSPKKILIVEDEKPYLHALSLKLEHAGYAVDGARYGEDALRLLQE
jgi:DNA-binding response OmpR family regulator